MYYKLRQVLQLQIGGRALQSVMDLLKISTGRIKCDDYPKLRHYTTVHPVDENRARLETERLKTESETGERRWEKRVIRTNIT